MICQRRSDGMVGCRVVAKRSALPLDGECPPPTLAAHRGLEPGGANLQVCPAKALVDVSGKEFTHCRCKFVVAAAATMVQRMMALFLWCMIYTDRTEVPPFCSI
jgi:hypothetical protein